LFDFISFDKKIEKFEQNDDPIGQVEVVEELTTAAAINSELLTFF
jgi:hypothetical protein